MWRLNWAYWVTVFNTSKMVCGGDSDGTSANLSNAGGVRLDAVWRWPDMLRGHRGTPIHQHTNEISWNELTHLSNLRQPTNDWDKSSSHAATPNKCTDSTVLQYTRIQLVTCRTSSVHIQKTPNRHTYPPGVQGSAQTKQMGSRAAQARWESAYTSREMWATPKDLQNHQ